MRGTRGSGPQTSVSTGGFHLRGPSSFDIRGFHTAELRFPVVVRGLRNPGFAAHIFDGASGFDGLQSGDDLVFGESGFAYGDLLQGYIQYAGRSLNVNGPVYRDAYRLTQIDFC